jgi:hypothetical protein
MSTDDADRDAWIAAHGSERLRLALAHGMAGQSLGVYRDERLAHELPGWLWADRELEVSPVHNPSLAGLRELASAPAVASAPTATLVKVRQESDWEEALLIERLPWAPGRRAFRMVRP